jgi:hypothetical protein
MVLSHPDAGEIGGDDDDLEVRFGISNRHTKTNQRRKVQMPAQTQRLCALPAHELEQVDDTCCIRKDAKLLDARRF